MRSGRGVQWSAAPHAPRSVPFEDEFHPPAPVGLSSGRAVRGFCHATIVSVITGRFAPSPTGDLHLGNLRTALVAWLCVQRGGPGSRFLVRFEDLDRVTSSRGIAAGQLADLAALGMVPAEEPVFQSDRFGLYEAAIGRLETAGVTYPCFCTRREVREAAEAPHGVPGRYPGTCRGLGAAERATRESEGRPGALRLDVAAAVSAGLLPERLEVQDGLRGVLAGPVVDLVDDVVLRRNDGVPSYNVAVVVDDALQEVTQVVRGDDLWEVTPTQVALQVLLGLPTPAYLHVPLKLGDDGERLAKRHGAVTLADLRSAGVGVDEVREMLLEEIREFLPSERTNQRP